MEILIFLIIVLAFFGYKLMTSSKSTPAWVSQFENIQYSNEFANTGIAIDGANQKIHLMENGFTKTYSFSDVRDWKTNLQTGGHIYGGGAQGMLANSATNAGNVKSSGLFISVKDIEHPEWHVKLCLPGNKEDRKIHARWMEIMKQTINEGSLDMPAVAATEIKKAPATKRFCSTCGAKSNLESAFCEDCGTALKRV